MGVVTMSSEMLRWREAALAEPSADPCWSVPLHVLLGEAVDAALFHATYWDPPPGGPARRGLVTAAGVGKTPLHAGTAEEILSLVRACEDAHTRYLVSVGHAPKSVAERGRALLMELRLTVEFLLDDGVDDDADAQLARVVDAHAHDPETLDALALALVDFAALADLHRDAMNGLGGFSVAHIDEARSVAAQLWERPPTPAASPETAAAHALRNRLMRVLFARVSAVRAAARFVYRDDPAIARKVTSAYERTRRAKARRASEARAHATPASGSTP